MSYIFIQRIRVCGANAQSAYWVVSGPSPFAYLGFSRKLVIDMTGEVGKSSEISAAILHHDFEIKGEKGEYGSFLPSQLAGAGLTSGGSTDYVGSGMSLSLQPVALCNFTASIIINVGDMFDGIDEGRISSAVRKMRISGGQIQDFARISIVDSLKDIKVPSGFFIQDRKDILVNIPSDKKIATMINAISLKNNDTAFNWVAPMCLGYYPLTEFKERDGVRSALNHAYAEPVVGLIQYVSKHDFYKEGKQVLPFPFWRYKKELDAFVVSC